MKKLLIFALLPLSLKAQVYLDWSCPQDKYESIPQLPITARVQVSWSEKKGQYQFDPNIFKNVASPLTTTNLVKVNYSACIEKFIKKFSTQTELNIPKDTDALRAQIKKQPYFKGNYQLIPGSLPSSNLEVTDDEVKENFNLYCSNESGMASNEILFSKKSLDYIKNIPKGSDFLTHTKCIDKLNIFATSYIEDFKLKACQQDDSICINLKYNDLTRTTQDVVKDLEKRKNVGIQEKLNKFRFVPNEELGKVGLQKKLNAVDFKCTDLSTTVTHLKKAVDFASAIEESIPLMVDKMGGDCLRKFTQDYAANIPTPNISEDKEIQELCKNNQYDWCAKAMKSTEDKLRVLKKLISASYGVHGDEYLKCDDVCDPKNETPLNQILEKMKDHPKAIACMELKKGDTKVISRDSAVFNYGDSHYALKKISDSVFEAQLDIRFIPTAGATISAEKLRDRFTQCLDEFTPYLKGPNGESLNIKLLEVNELAKIPVNSRPPKTEIKFMKNIRASSREYDQDINCPTMAHETLHLLGLCDEYDGSRDGYMCRTSAAVTSVMSNQSAAFAQAIPTVNQCKCTSEPCNKIISPETDPKIQEVYFAASLFQVMTNHEIRKEYCKEVPEAKISISDYKVIGNPLTAKNDGAAYQFAYYKIPSGFNNQFLGKVQINCHCSNGNQDCLDEMKKVKALITENPNLKRNYCPDYSFNRQEVVTKKIKPSENVTIDGDTFYLTSKPKMKSLLHPLQFERIINGDCPEKAKPYNECAKWAYKRSGCDEKPKHCEDGKTFLGVSQ